MYLMAEKVGIEITKGPFGVGKESEELESERGKDGK